MLQKIEVIKNDTGEIQASFERKKGKDLVHDIWSSQSPTLLVIMIGEDVVFQGSLDLFSFKAVVK